MLRVLDGNEKLAERLSVLERSQTMSITSHQAHEGASVVTQSTIRETKITTLNSYSPESTTEHLPVTFTFEADLRNSWVYQRSHTRGPRTFSLATSTQLTQSWSFFSGLSLSKISNLAVQALPIYSQDLLNSDHYVFGEVDHLVGSSSDTITESVFERRVRLAVEANNIGKRPPILEPDPKELQRMSRWSRSNRAPSRGSIDNNAPDYLQYFLPVKPADPDSMSINARPSSISSTTSRASLLANLKGEWYCSSISAFRNPAPINDFGYPYLSYTFNEVSLSVSSALPPYTRSSFGPVL